MANCTVAFPKAIEIGCILELVEEIKSKNISINTIQKGLWVVGCAMENFKKPVVASSGPQSIAAMLAVPADIQEAIQYDFDSDDERLEFYCDKLADAVSVDWSKIDWAVVASFVMMIIQILSKK